MIEVASSNARERKEPIICSNCHKPYVEPPGGFLYVKNAKQNNEGIRLYAELVTCSPDAAAELAKVATQGDLKIIVLQIK